MVMFCVYFVVGKNKLIVESVNKLCALTIVFANNYKAQSLF